MIERYSRPQMSRLWSLESKYRTWLKVEVLACQAWAEKGVIPRAAAQTIAARADFDLARIEEIEAETKHDVIAFLTAVAEKVGPEARYIHYGLTSSDVLDTAFGCLLKDAADLLLEDLAKLMAAVRERAFEHKRTVMIGRSHGMHAEPITFGLKLAVWHDELARHKTRLEAARESVAVGKVSGAVGTFGNVEPEVEEFVCKKLGLKPAPASTQIVQRDRQAAFFTCLAVLAGTVEKMAVEIRHLQRSEVAEAEEFFSKGQKGSSAMPHKRNPIASENLAGCARLMRSYALAAMENQALWHERDISHSSVERVIGPDSTILLDYMLDRMTGLIKNLVVYPLRMQANLDSSQGLIFSQQLLLALAEAGVSREEAYAKVQARAMEAIETKSSLKKLISRDEWFLEKLGRDKLADLFDLSHHLRHLDLIFERVFGRA
ncbi:MAG: adenylosuccinate lyase [Deltaproteobacteria bacterium]|nr:adenylosuccinate lyase [Deltaproteobacteria bacterium]